MEPAANEPWDAVIVGGGPGGATAAFYLARAGLRACVVERETFPRYCVGESLLPYIIPILEEMDVLDEVARAGFLRKLGAVFGDSSAEHVVRIRFDEGLEPQHDYSYQVERDRFDQILLDHAIRAGATRLDATVHRVVTDGERIAGVVVSNRDGTEQELRARLVIDASGRSFFLGRRLDLLEFDQKLDTASVFSVFDGVPQLADAEIGDPIVLTFPLGWFWFIPFVEGRWSVGVVVDRATYDDFPERSMPAFMRAMVERAGGRIANLMANARPVREFHALRKYSRFMRQIAGPGWVAVGDAAMFIDPVFAAGVYVAVIEARMAMELAIPLLKERVPIEGAHFQKYADEVKQGYAVFARFIYAWQDPAFRKFFFGAGPRPRVLIQTITTILSGGVFDRKLISRGEDMFFKYAARDKTIGTPATP